ncbi:MAG: BtpA/SgcQ family protein, partial [Dongiaceae bacterium]
MQATSVAKPRPHALETLFGRRRAIIGVIHARPLPGSPRYDGEPIDAIYDQAVADAPRYAVGGFDGVIVENHGD